jgi:hypothetical protein
MAETVKIIGFETGCNTIANTFNGARSVRITNTLAIAVLITQANSGGTMGTFTVLPGSGVVIVKGSNDTLASSNTAGVFGVPAGFSY